MKKIFFLLVTIIALAGCREKYTSPAVNPSSGYLVVEGFININGPTTIRLTRTSKLADTTTIYDKKATVSIQSLSGSNYPLTETSNGIYTGSPVLPNNSSYRIRIVSGGKEYLSAYTSPITTPAIDSVTWIRNADGLQISAHAKGTASQQKYYQWKTEETWEYNSDFTTKWRWKLDASKVVVGVIENDISLPGYEAPETKCWKAENSNSLLLASTENLSDNIVHPLLVSIPSGSVKLSILYSVNVKQYSVSKDNYDFLNMIKKNTEKLGSIFDAQPSEIKGNITCTTTPGETVIGFIETTQEQVKRIFIKSTDVPAWGYTTDCVTDIIDLSKPGSTIGSVDTNTVAPLDYKAGSYLAVVKPLCIKCSKRGGTIKKPVFWP
jgi:hypothetical protein